jgi:hypothetical protein
MQVIMCVDIDEARREDTAVDLAELANGACRTPSHERHALFRSVGLGSDGRLF